MKHYRIHLRSLLLGILLAIPSYAATSDIVYFYNPESNINNFVVVKDQFESYLSLIGPCEFQAFSSRETFENTVTKQSRGIIMVSSWHYRMLHSRMPLEPVLVGVRAGRSTQRYILCAARSIRSIDEIYGAKVATSASVTFTRTLLQQMLENSKTEQIHAIKLITVPKDLDALLAIGFDVVKFAVTTDVTLASLRNVSPAESRLVKEIAASPDTLLPLTAIVKPGDADVQRVVEHIDDMDRHPDGRRTLNMISLDGLQPIKGADRLSLEQ